MARRLYATLLVFLLLALVASPSAFAQFSDSGGGDDAAAAGMSFVVLCCIGLAALVAIAFLVFWIFMLVDCFQRENDEFPNATENTKTVWIIILLVSWLLSLNWLAAIIYYFMVKKKMPRRAKA